MRRKTVLSGALLLVSEETRGRGKIAMTINIIISDTVRTGIVPIVKARGRIGAILVQEASSAISL